MMTVAKMDHTCITDDELNNNTNQIRCYLYVATLVSTTIY